MADDPNSVRAFAKIYRGGATSERGKFDPVVNISPDLFRKLISQHSLPTRLVEIDHQAEFAFAYYSSQADRNSILSSGVNPRHRNSYFILIDDILYCVIFSPPCNNTPNVVVYAHPPLPPVYLPPPPLEGIFPLYPPPPNAVFPLPLLPRGLPAPPPYNPNCDPWRSKEGKVAEDRKETNEEEMVELDTEQDRAETKEEEMVELDKEQGNIVKGCRLMGQMKEIFLLMQLTNNASFKGPRLTSLYWDRGLIAMSLRFFLAECLCCSIDKLSQEAASEQQFTFIKSPSKA